MYKITVEGVIKFTVYLPFRNCDNFQFSSSSVEDLKKMVEQYLKKKTKIVKDGGEVFLEVL